MALGFSPYPTQNHHVTRCTTQPPRHVASAERIVSLATPVYAPLRSLNHPNALGKVFHLALDRVILVVADVRH
eukprot:scaffold407_cov251-Pinguiococcus_pyrenoidosus.AAC.14